MRSSADTHLLIHNTMRITPGHLDEYRLAIDRAVEFVEQHGPQLMVQTFIDAENLRAHSFQLHADSDSIRTQWTISDPYIAEVMRHCEVERLVVYGQPDDAVMRSLPESGVDWQVVPRQIGFVEWESRVAE